MSSYDLEQDILNCWTITNDLDLLLKECEKIENAEVADQISNIVLGIKYVYDLRFQRCWKSFENYIWDQRPSIKEAE